MAKFKRFLEENIKIIRKLSQKEAEKLIRSLRISGKHKGNKAPFIDNLREKEYALVKFPLSELSKDELETIELSSREELVDRYAKSKIKNPIYVYKSGRDGWYVSDGGHRVMASIKRGENFIPAIVPLKDV